MIAEIELSGHGVGFGVASSLLQILGYVLYNLFIWKGHASGNGSSWAIWTFGSILNLATYHDLAQDWAKELLPIVCAMCCIGTFIHIWKKHGFGKLERYEWGILWFDVAITIWWFTTSNNEANLIYQISTILSFAPMIIGMAKGKDYENPIPWVIWTVAYQFMLFTVFSRWEKWQDAVYPGVCLVLHLAVAILACIVTKKTKN